MGFSSDATAAQSYSIVNAPLAGLLVLDLSEEMDGAYCTALLSDAGAIVTRIAEAGRDVPRAWAQRVLGESEDALRQVQAAFVRGKRRMELDLASDEGRGALERLAESADVIVDTFEPGAREKLGISYDELRRRRPQLVTASVSLWGVEAGDPLAERQAAAVVAEAESSVHFRGAGDGSPVPLSFPAGEMAAGMSAYGAIVTAVLERERTGRGRHLDISMVHVLLAFNAIMVTGAQIPSQPGTGTAGYGVFRSQDGWIVLGVNTDSLWTRLCACMGRPDLATDPRFAHYSERDRRVPEANALISEWTARHTSSELVELVGPSGVPVGRIADPRAALESAQFRRLGYLVPVADGHGGTLEVPANPLGFGTAR